MSLRPEAARILKWTPKSSISRKNPIDARSELPVPFTSKESVALIRNIDCGGVNCRFYQPNGYREEPSHLLGLTIYIHGGGWVLGNLDMVDHLCRCLANKTDNAVLSIDYRLSPEHPYPIPMNDCVQAASWAFDHAETELRCDQERFCILGESAGANLALAVVNHSIVPIKLQVLFYPVTDCRPLAGPAAYSGLVDGSGSSYDLFGKDNQYNLSGEDMIWFYKHYLSETEALEGQVSDDAYFAQMAELAAISPVLENDTTLKASPPTLMITAEMDCLRDDGENYLKRLQSLGVHSFLHQYPGQIHGFFMHQLGMKDAREALDRVASAIRQALQIEPYNHDELFLFTPLATPDVESKKISSERKSIVIPVPKKKQSSTGPGLLLRRHSGR